MWTTLSKISLFVVLVLVATLALSWSISRSNAKVLALSIVQESGRIEVHQDTLIYRSFDKNKSIDDRTINALRYLGRSQKGIKVIRAIK